MWWDFPFSFSFFKNYLFPLYRGRKAQKLVWKLLKLVWKLLKLQKLRNSCGNFRNYTTFLGALQTYVRKGKREKRILKKGKRKTEVSSHEHVGLLALLGLVRATVSTILVRGHSTCNYFYYLTILLSLICSLLALLGLAEIGCHGRGVDYSTTT